MGTISCPGTASFPNSMAVARSGLAYVGFMDGSLFKVRVATAECQSTPFAVDQSGFAEFGMGYVRDDEGDGETLYVASQDDPSRLAWIDTGSFVLHVIGPFTMDVTTPELRARAPVSCLLSKPSTTMIRRSSRSTRRRPLSSQNLYSLALSAGTRGHFHSGEKPFTRSLDRRAARDSVVTRFRPSDGSIVRVAATDEVIVGAGVSTCAP